MLSRRLLGRGLCEMIFQQTTTNSDVATNRFHDDAHISLKACFTHGLFRFIRHLFRWRMTHKDIDNSQILIVVTGSSVSFPIRLSPSTPDTSGAARQNTREVLVIIISDAVYTGCSTMDNCHVRCRYGVTWLAVTQCLLVFVGAVWTDQLFLIKQPTCLLVFVWAVWIGLYGFVMTNDRK